MAKQEIERVPFSTGTDEQILAMIQAADRGELDLSEVWKVGDERKVKLSKMKGEGIEESHDAQQVTFVLMDSTLKGLKPVDESMPLHFAVGLKDCLKEPGHMNFNWTNAGGWKYSNRRLWCNEQFANALPEIFRLCFRPFIWKTGRGAGEVKGFHETLDLFALPAEAMVFGKEAGYAEDGFAQDDEAALYNQWDWYKEPANRIKKIRGSANYWWEASPNSGNSYYFCCVNSNGYADYYGAYSTLGLAPFGCI